MAENNEPAAAAIIQEEGVSLITKTLMSFSHFNFMMPFSIILGSGRDKNFNLRIPNLLLLFGGINTGMMLYKWTRNLWNWVTVGC